jgi:hypothetical protein
MTEPEPKLSKQAIKNLARFEQLYGKKNSSQQALRDRAAEQIFHGD